MAHCANCLAVLLLFAALLPTAFGAGEIIGSNLISPISLEISPNPPVESQPAIFYVNTDSAVDLTDVKCVPPRGAGNCTCTIGYKGDYSNFKCNAIPPVFGTYSLMLRNQRGEGGTMAISLNERKRAPTPTEIGPLRKDLPSDIPILVLFLSVILIIAYEFKEHVMFRTD